MPNKPVFRLSALAGLSLLVGCTTMPDAEQITIKRDQHGTPHIYADTTYGLFYGYAITQNRLSQLEAQPTADRNILTGYASDTNQ